MLSTIVLLRFVFFLFWHITVCTTPFFRICFHLTCASVFWDREHSLPTLYSRLTLFTFWFKSVFIYQRQSWRQKMLASLWIIKAKDEFNHINFQMTRSLVQHLWKTIFTLAKFWRFIWNIILYPHQYFLLKSWMRMGACVLSYWKKNIKKYLTHLRQTAHDPNCSVPKFKIMHHFTLKAITQIYFLSFRCIFEFESLKQRHLDELEPIFRYNTYRCDYEHSFT